MDPNLLFFYSWREQNQNPNLSFVFCFSIQSEIEKQKKRECDKTQGNRKVGNFSFCLFGLCLALFMFFLGFVCMSCFVCCLLFWFSFGFNKAHRFNNKNIKTNT